MTPESPKEEQPHSPVLSGPGATAQQFCYVLQIWDSSMKNFIGPLDIIKVEFQLKQLNSTGSKYCSEL